MSFLRNLFRRRTRYVAATSAERSAAKAKRDETTAKLRRHLKHQRDCERAVGVWTW